MKEYKIISEQPSSDLCFVCGVKNDCGLKTRIFKLEDNKTLAIFSGKDIHQSYPNRMHGGVITAILDEVVGRAIQTTTDIWGVTMKFATKYIKPVPLNKELYAVGEITKITRHLFKGEGYICDEDGNILAQGEGLYRILPTELITGKKELSKEEWSNRYHKLPIKVVKLPK